MLPTSHSITVLDRSREGWQVVFGVNVLSQDSTHPICRRRGRTWVWSGEAGWRNRWKERAKVRERKRDRGIEGETVHLMKIQRNVWAGGVYMRVCVCACFKESHSVTPRISISLHDSPPDLHTRTCTCTLRYFTSVYRFAHRKWGLANVHVHISLAFPTARQLKKCQEEKQSLFTETMAQRK